MKVKIKPITIQVHPEMYNYMEVERKRFMKKHHIKKLTNTKFTENLAMQLKRKGKCKL